MAPTPLSVGFRLTFLYTVLAFRHKQQNYLECVPSADSSGYDAVGRSGLGNVGVSSLQATPFAALAPYYNPVETTFDGWLLEQRVGTSFVFLASGTTAVVPTGASTAGKAAGYCVSGKDTGNRELPVYWYESFINTTTKVASYAALPASDKLIADIYYNAGAGAGAGDPWNWKRSRDGERPLRWLALVVDSNEKLRRLRRIK